MDSEKSNTYDSEVGAKANAPLARRLRELVTDTNALKKYLGCTTQAINQYKQGTSYPKTENIIKIADFYKVSVDYLLGITETPNRDTDLQAVCEYTGLSVGAIEKLRAIKSENRRTAHSYIISLLIENENAEHLLSLIGKRISITSRKRDALEHCHPVQVAMDNQVTVIVDGTSVQVRKDGLVDSVLQADFIASLEFLTEDYLSSYEKTPDQLDAEWDTYTTALLQREASGGITREERAKLKLDWLKGASEDG